MQDVYSLVQSGGIKLGADLVARSLLLLYVCFAKQAFSDSINHVHLIAGKIKL